MAEHGIEFDEFCSAMDQANVDKWILEITRWESDPTQTNPFEETVQGILQRPVQYVYAY